RLHEANSNALRVCPWWQGVLSPVCGALGQISSIVLEPGERLAGAGRIAAGDTARWIIGATESGSGASRRVHILVKPTRDDISTNRVVTPDRRDYMSGLRAPEAVDMPSVAWAAPARPPGTG